MLNITLIDDLSPQHEDMLRTARIGRPNAKRPAQNDVLILAKQERIKQIWSCSGTGPLKSYQPICEGCNLISSPSGSPRLHVLIDRWDHCHAAYSVNLKVTHDGTHWALARKNTDHLEPLHYRLSNLPQESPLLNHGLAVHRTLLLCESQNNASFLSLQARISLWFFDFQNCHLGSRMCNTSFTIFFDNLSPFPFQNNSN